MINIIIGTKAQLIKVAPIMACLQAKKISYNFIFTGQHKDTVDELRENFNIKEPDVVLYEGRDITGIPQMFYWAIRIIVKTLFGKKQIFPDSNDRDIVLIHGDTFSTLLGAFMAKIARKRIAHIESGLRSFRLFHPFPEEITRLITFHLCHVYYCPGNWAVCNLRRFKGEKINTYTNTLYDSLRMAREKIDKIDVELPDEKYAIVSLHRFENIFNRRRFLLLINYLRRISHRMKLLFILHKPTEMKLKEYGLFETLSHSRKIELRPRYDYFRFIKLLVTCEFVITDGGSNQEECAFLGKPTLLFRKRTERLDGIGANVVLSNYQWNIIRDFISNYKHYTIQYEKIGESPSSIIVRHLISLNRY